MADDTKGTSEDAAVKSGKALLAEVKKSLKDGEVASITPHGFVQINR